MPLALTPTRQVRCASTGLLERVRRGEVSRVVITKLDRLTRSTRDLADVRKARRLPRLTRGELGFGKRRRPPRREHARRRRAMGT
jgi:hypothetical protein